MRLIVLITVLLIATFPLLALEEGDPDLVGLWLFDEGGGDTVTDSSGNGNDGVINGAFDWVDGKIGGAIFANGGGSIDVASSPSLDSISDALTVAAFFRVEADSDTGVRRNGAFLLEDQSATEPVPAGWSFRIWTTDGLSPGIYGKTELELGVWYHIAGVWDGATMSLYIDGVPEAELLTDGGADTDGAWGGTLAKTANPLQLKFGPESYTGAIDEIVLFSRALSEDEIRSLAEKGWVGALDVEPRGKLATAWAALKTAQGN